MAFLPMSWPAAEPAIQLSRSSMDGRVKPGHDRSGA